MHMKKLSFFAFALVALSAVYFVACQKEEQTSVSTANSAVEQPDEVVDRSSFTLTNFCSCARGRSCKPWGLANTKANGLNLDITPQAHQQYNVSGAGLYYQIYAGLNATGTLLASFRCTQSAMQYVPGNLANNTDYSIRVSLGQPPFLTQLQILDIRTGYCNGQSCDGSGNPN